MVLTDTGHLTLAETMLKKDFWLAWGTVPIEQDWTDTPLAEIIGSTELIQEVGRVKALVKEFVNIDDTGTIEVDGLKWVISPIRTKYIYLKFTFDQNMNSDNSIYQLGIFTDVVPNEDNLLSEYLQPIMMDDIGNLLLTENQPVLYRNSATRETYEFIITF
jgi:hypothetical protein